MLLACCGSVSGEISLAYTRKVINRKQLSRLTCVELLSNGKQLNNKNLWYSSSLSLVFPFGYKVRVKV